MLDVPPQLRSLLTSKFGVVDSQFEDDVCLADLNFDSLAILEFSVTCNEDLGIQLTDTEMNGNMRLSELSALVSARLATK